MKRTFLAKRNALLSSARISWGAFALLFAVLALFVRLIAPNAFSHAFAPAFRASDALAAASHSFFSGFRDNADIALRNEELTKENASLALENQALKQAVSGLSGLAREGKGITAGILARPPVSPYDTFEIAAGSKDGIKNGMEVFGEDGVPLGIVSSVLDDFSRVTLFSSPGMSTIGWVGRAHLPLTIKGAGAGAFTASIARAAGIAEGDTVFVPGPGMLPIGSVVRVEDDPSSPSVTLRILPASNLFSVGWVVARDVGTALRSALSTTTSLLP